MTLLYPETFKDYFILKLIKTFWYKKDIIGLRDGNIKFLPKLFEDKRHARFLKKLAECERKIINNN